MKDNEYLKVCTLLKPIGLNGEVKVFSTTTFKSLRYKKGNTLFLFYYNSYIPLTIKNYRKKDEKFDVLSFNELPSINDVEKYLNCGLFALKDYSILNKDEYFYSDLLDCIVINQDDVEIGKVIKIEEFPSQITLKIKNSQNKDIYIPFLDVFIKDVNLDKKIILVNTIEGMIWNLKF